MRSNLILILALTTCALGCSGDADRETGNTEIGQAAYNSALDAAMKSQGEARKNGSDWTSSQTLMDAAAELAAEGQWQEAVTLMNEARQQYELALAQNAREALDWQDRVVR